MIIEDLKNDLKNRVSERRYSHVIGVLDMGEKINKNHGVSSEKLQIAILLHDILKEEKIETLEEMLKQYNFQELEVAKNIKDAIIHGFAGAIYAMEKYKIYDEDILNAVKYHSIGRENMSTLEKIVYIADGIELGRDYPNVEEMRELVFKDINRGMLYELNEKIEYFKNKNKALHPNAYKMQKWLEEVCGGE